LDEFEPALDGYGEIFVSRFLPPAFERSLQGLWVAHARRDPWDRFALPVEVLSLPEKWKAAECWLAPRAASPGTIERLWVEAAESPLLIPAGRDLRDVLRVWRIEFFASPRSAGLHFDASVLADVAWTVLARAGRELAIPDLALVATSIEELRYRADSPEDNVDVLGLPEPIRNRLLSAARAGQRILFPRALQWVIRELAAAPAEEIAAWRRRVFDADDERGLLALAFFPSLSTGRPPPTHETLLAAWFLQETFQTEEEEASDDLLSMTTVLSFGSRPGGSWARWLERWRAVWSVEDCHNSVAAATPPPSRIRALFKEAVGVSPTEWFSAIWFICARWHLGVEGETSLPSTVDEVHVIRTGNGLVSFSPAFRKAFDAHVVASITEFGAAARAEAGSSYAGLGSLPQRDSVACRNHPVLRTACGQVVPLSLDLLAERAASLHRFVLKNPLRGARNVNQTIGLMYEAYLTDVLRQLEPRVAVVDAPQIAAVLKEGQNCDVVVGYAGRYVCIEVALLIPARGIADGRHEKLAEVLRWLHEEADQAEATAARLGALTAAVGLPAPQSVTTLVVTEGALQHTPVLMDRLREMEPVRNPRFVCSAHELEDLVALGESGVSVVHAVATWKTRAREGPLSELTGDLARLRRPAPWFGPDDYARWQRLLPGDPVAEEAAMPSLVAAREAMLAALAAHAVQMADGGLRPAVAGRRRRRPDAHAPSGPALRQA
jgi:hypothetical protein